MQAKQAGMHDLGKSYEDEYVIACYNIWKYGVGAPPQEGPPPFSERRVRRALNRRKQYFEKQERERWAEKMRMKAERKAAREAKALQEKKAMEEQKAPEAKNQLPGS